MLSSPSFAKSSLLCFAPPTRANNPCPTTGQFGTSVLRTEAMQIEERKRNVRVCGGIQAGPRFRTHITEPGAASDGAAQELGPKRS